jgi:poly(A) polymerase
MNLPPPIPTTKAPCDREDALEVLKRLRQAGHVAYFAGGCVRDMLLGLAPKDYDVATDALPKRVRELFSNTQAVGQAFGVILVKHGPSTVEVATFRSDGTYSDGRRPDAVAFTTAEHDAQRRDFTINGLFLDPLDNPPAGKVIDYVNGQEDLRNHILRSIGDPHRRFAEDHLRLLRAVRFAARFGLSVESETARSIRENAPKLKGISPERIADELRVMLTPVTRQRAWPMLWEYGLIDVIFRFLPSSEPAGFDAARSLFLNVAPEQSISLALGLAAGTLEYRLGGSSNLLPLLARQEIARTGRAMRDALKISNDELDALVEILEPLTQLLGAEEPTLAAKKRFLARPTSGDSRLLMRAIAALEMNAQRIASLEAEFEQLIKTDVSPTPLLTGDDLVAAGFRPGPAFKGILDAVYDAQLEGRIATREEALQMASRINQDTKN